MTERTPTKEDTATARKIVTASDLRGALLGTIEALLEGRINVAQANAAAALSAEVHKSIRQDWDMRLYANEHLQLEAGRVVEVIGHDL